MPSAVGGLNTSHFFSVGAEGWSLFVVLYGNTQPLVQGSNRGLLTGIGHSHAPWARPTAHKIYRRMYGYTKQKYIMMYIGNL